MVQPTSSNTCLSIFFGKTYLSRTLTITTIAVTILSLMTIGLAFRYPIGSDSFIICLSIGSAMILPTGGFYAFCLINCLRRRCIFSSQSEKNIFGSPLVRPSSLGVNNDPPPCHGVTKESLKKVTSNQQYQDITSEWFDNYSWNAERAKEENIQMTAKKEYGKIESLAKTTLEKWVEEFRQDGEKNIKKLVDFLFEKFKAPTFDHLPFLRYLNSHLLNATLLLDGVDFQSWIYRVNPDRIESEIPLVFPKERILLLLELFSFVIGPSGSLKSQFFSDLKTFDSKEDVRVEIRNKDNFTADNYLEIDPRYILILSDGYFYDLTPNGAEEKELIRIFETTWISPRTKTRFTNEDLEKLQIITKRKVTNIN